MEHLLGKEFLMMTSFPELFDDTDEEEKEEYREAS
jgi:hypothetical protein